MRLTSFLLSILVLSISTVLGQSVSDKRVLTLDGAKQVIAAAVAEAKKAPNPTGVAATVRVPGVARI